MSFQQFRKRRLFLIKWVVHALILTVADAFASISLRRLAAFGLRFRDASQ